MLFLTGRWDDALAEISAAREAPDHLALTVHLDGLAALIAVHRQDREQLARLRGGLDRPLITGPARHTYDDRSWGRGLAVLADGDPTAAFGVLSAAWEQCAQGSREYCGHYLLPDLAVLAGLLGEREEARRAVAQLARYAADRPSRPPGLLTRRALEGAGRNPARSGSQAMTKAWAAARYRAAARYPSASELQDSRRPAWLMHT